MDYESDFSFDYDDGNSLLLLEDSDCKSLHSVSSLPEASDAEKSAALHKSPNPVSSFKYRSLQMSHYINDNLVGKARKLQDTVMQTLLIPQLLILLHYKKWLVDELTSDYFTNWPKLRDALGLPKQGSVPTTIRRVENFTCSICCETGNIDVYALACGHTYCAMCYGHYVYAAIARGTLIRCIDVSCELSLLHEIADRLYHLVNSGEESESEPTSAELLQIATADPADQEDDPADEYEDQFVNVDLSGRTKLEEPTDLLLSNIALVFAAKVTINTQHSIYRWCPAIDCADLAELVNDTRGPTFDLALDQNLSNVAIVKCPRFHEFCFDCQQENHLPCPCWLVKKWIQKCEDDSETANWIEANTQLCPKCHSQIEKSGGCNHMTCGKCNNEFCWICLGEWAQHQSSFWQCNRFDLKEFEETKKKRSDKQYSLSRYLHFYKRFSVHQRSMAGDEKTLKSVHRCMLMYMRMQLQTSETSLSWNDVQFLSDAILSLASGRKTLMWTYAFAFYLRSTNFSSIFEGMQDYLNKTVEDLSQCFEQINSAINNDAVKKIMKRKTEIVNLAALVQRRQNLLIECAYSGLQQGTLQLAN